MNTTDDLKRPFRQTRELIKLALNSGLTQKQIADRCRVDPSKVSRWNSGEKKARTSEIEPLLDEFGHKLRRRTYRLYRTRNEAEDLAEYVRVEGPVILQESFDRTPTSDTRFRRPPAAKRLVIHSLGRGRFMAITQQRIVLERGETMNTGNDGADWLSQLHELSSPSELINGVERYAGGLRDEAERLRVPFAIRKALLDHGFPVDGIVSHEASW